MVHSFRCQFVFVSELRVKFSGILSRLSPSSLRMLLLHFVFFFSACKKRKEKRKRFLYLPIQIESKCKVWVRRPEAAVIAPSDDEPQGFKIFTRKVSKDAMDPLDGIVEKEYVGREYVQQSRYARCCFESACRARNIGNVFVRNHSATREFKIGSNPTGPEPGEMFLTDLREISGILFCRFQTGLIMS